MSKILDRERALYTEVWDTVTQYADASPGEAYVPMFLEMAGLTAGSYVTPSRLGGEVTTPYRLLDAGCGTGRAGVALAGLGFDVVLADITGAGLDPSTGLLPFQDICLWDALAAQLFLPGGKVDYVYCADVLTHVPLPFTMLVVSRMLEFANKGVFLSISLQTDVYGYWVGQALHQSVQSFVEWRDQLRAVGVVREARDLLSAGVYYVTPRRDALDA